MERSRRILICLACATALNSVAYADNAVVPKSSIPHKFYSTPQPSLPQPAGVTPGNSDVSSDKTQSDTPYGSIVTRNVFALNPIPVTQPVDPATLNPPPKITLTGITTIFGPKEALFKAAGIARPGQPPQDQSYILQEGQGQDDIYVTSVDVQKGLVIFNNHGVTQTIMLAAGVASGGAAASSGGPPPNYAGFAGRAGHNNIPPTMRPRFQQQSGGGNGMAPTGNNFNSAGQFNNNSYNNSTYNPTANANNPGGQLSADDEQALIAAQHAQLQSEGNSTASIFPPTKYDNDANQEAGNPTDGSTTTTPFTPAQRVNGFFRPNSSAPPP